MASFQKNQATPGFNFNPPAEEDDDLFDGFLNEDQDEN